MHSLHAVRFAALLLVLLVACSDGGPSDPDRAGPPADIEVTGSGQSGAAGAALPAPLVATVVDDEGRAVQGATVAWSTDDGSIAPSTATTNAQGQAQATWTLEARLGAQSALVTVADLEQSIGATATMPDVVTLLGVSGDSQSDTIGATLDTLVVEVRAPGGAPLAGVAVSWSVIAGGGTITPLDASTAASGRARAVWTLGTIAGAHDVTVTAPNLNTLAFDAVAEAGAPATIDIAQDSLLLDKWGDSASATASVHDRAGNDVGDANVTWSSPDTSVARVSATGTVSSHRFGRVLLTASVGAVSAELPVRVVQQRNSACIVPIPIVRGAAAGVPALGPAQILSHLPDPAWDGARSLPVDYDGDGDDDIIRLEYSYPSSVEYWSEIRVFEAAGGALADVTDSMGVAAIFPDHPRDFEIRDFDGDFAEEVYVAQHGYDAVPFPGAANLFLDFDGDSIVDRAPQRFAPYETDGFSHGSSSADIDCDGDLDIVELNVSTAAPNRLWLNDGSGSFSAAGADAFPIAEDILWQEVVFIDFDRDVDPDIFLGARSGTGWNVDAILVNDGFGGFRRYDGIDLPAPHFTPNHAINNAKAADFDGDGWQDLFLLEIPQPFSTSSVARLWLNQRDGTFVDASAEWGLPAECTGELVEPLFVVDFNGDLWPDATVPNGCAELGGAGMLINTGTGFTSVPNATIEPWLQLDAITPADVDGDGDLDLFFGEHGGEPILVENEG